MILDLVFASVLAFAPPAPANDVAQGLTADQQAALRQAFNLPPGTDLEVEITNRDGGSLRTRESGRGVGAGAFAEGDKLDSQFTGTPPSVGRLADGSLTGAGGGSTGATTAVALQIPPLPWQNPLFWIGLLCLGGAGFGVYAGLRRLAAVLAAGGVGLLAAAFYPALLLWAVAAVLVAVAAPYVWAEWKRRQAEADAEAKKEALRAVVAGVEGSGVTEEAKRQVKAAVAREADAQDKAEIEAVKIEDNIGKYRTD